MTAHLVLPDIQCKSGVPLEHLTWIGQYIIDERPDVIVCIGDFADLPSLSSYDRGKKCFEGRRYLEDIQVTHRAMDILLSPLRTLQRSQRLSKHKPYSPRMILTLGNHEDRITRAIEDNPSQLEGIMSLDDLGYKEQGWEVYPFLEVVEVDGVLYSHYFTSGVMGRPVQNAKALIKKTHQSATMGHVQITDAYFQDSRNGSMIVGLLAGVCYLHDEKYLTPQGNTHRRQIVMKRNVKDGAYDLQLLSLQTLKEMYAGA